MTALQPFQRARKVLALFIVFGIYTVVATLSIKFIEKYFNSIRGSISGEQNYGNRIDMLKQRIALCQSVQDIPYEYRGELDTQRKSAQIRKQEKDSEKH